MDSGKQFLLGIALIVGLCVASAIYAVLEQNRLNETVRSAPFIAAQSLDTICDTGKPVHTTLYTSSFGVDTPSSVFAFARLSIFVKATVRHEHDRWEEIQHQPEEIILFCKPGAAPIKLRASDLDKTDLATSYESSNSQFRTDIPKTWLPFVQVEGCRFKLQTLPTSKKVEVVGTFWKTNSGLRLKGFDYPGGLFESPIHHQAVLTVQKQD